MVNDGFSLTGTDIETYKGGKENKVVLCQAGLQEILCCLVQPRQEFTLANYEKYAEDTYGDDAEKILSIYPASNDQEANNQYNYNPSADRLICLIQF